METIRPYTNALRLLKSTNLRPTQQRLALARLLLDGQHRHLTAEQLHGEALAANVKVSLATVYNTLHQLTSVGLLREVLVDPGRSYFDTNTGDHHHFYFEESGEILDFPAQVMGSPLPSDIPEGTELTRVDVVVRLNGKAGSEQDGE